MQALQAVKAYLHPWETTVGLVLYVLCIVSMTIASETAIPYIYSGSAAIALLLALYLPIGEFGNCIFFSLPFSSILKLPVEAFGFVTLMQILLIARTMLEASTGERRRCLYITIGCIASQILSASFFEQTLMNVILWTFNVLLLYAMAIITRHRYININNLFLCFSLGVLTAGIINMLTGIHAAVFQEYRFCGLWTDPNFWGIFCIIGIAASLIACLKRPLTWVYNLPIAISLAYQGFLTLSRSFLIAFAFVLVLTSISFLRHEISIKRGILLASILCLSASFALPFVTTTLTERAFDVNDISNGRIDSALAYLEFFFQNPLSILFGFGYNNTMNATEAFGVSDIVSHCSYIDVLLEFGLVNIMLLIALLVFISRKWHFNQSSLQTIQGLVACLLLIYMAIFSMLKYSLVFLFFGVFLGSAVTYSDKTLSR